MVVVSTGTPGVARGFHVFAPLGFGKRRFIFTGSRADLPGFHGIANALVYTGFAMPHPPLEPDQSPPAPTVCSCGYDLTGLILDANARCPKCGVLLADLDEHERPPLPIGAVLIIMFVPSVFAGLSRLLRPALEANQTFVEVLSIVTPMFQILFAFGSIPSFYSLTMRLWPNASGRTRLLLVVAGIIMLATTVDPLLVRVWPYFD